MRENLFVQQWLGFIVPDLLKERVSLQLFLSALVKEFIAVLSTIIVNPMRGQLAILYSICCRWNVELQLIVICILL